MADSVGFYNWNFSIMTSKIQDLWKTKFIDEYAKIFSSNLVKELLMNENPIKTYQYMNLIPNWTKQEKCIKIIRKQL